GRRLAECVDISGNQLTIDAEGTRARALDGEAHLDMSAVQPLLKDLAQLVFEAVAVGRHAKMQVEKTMVYRLQRDGIRGRAALALDLRKPGHGTDRHGISASTPRAASATAGSKSTNCNSYKRL